MAISARYLEIEAIAVAVFIRHTSYRLGLFRSLNQSGSKEFRVRLREAQSRQKNTGLLPATRMVRIEALA